MKSHMISQEDSRYKTSEYIYSSIELFKSQFEQDHVDLDDLKKKLLGFY